MLKRGDTLVLASNNAGKLREMQAVFAPHGLNLVPIGQFSHSEPVEDGGSFAANALIKARAAAKLSGLPALADDSGLSVAALDGRPGVDTHPFTDRHGGDYDKAVLALLAEAKATTTPATFTSMLALVMPDGTEHLVEGKLSGNLTYPARGDEGFAFDYYFVPDGQTGGTPKTMAELGLAVKNKISHRALALTAFLRDYVA